MYLDLNIKRLDSVCESTTTSAVLRRSTNRVSACHWAQWCMHTALEGCSETECTFHDDVLAPLPHPLQPTPLETNLIRTRADKPRQAKASSKFFAVKQNNAKPEEKQTTSPASPRLPPPPNHHHHQRATTDIIFEFFFTSPRSFLNGYCENYLPIWQNGVSKSGKWLPL